MRIRLQLARLLALPLTERSSSCPAVLFGVLYARECTFLLRRAESRLNLRERVCTENLACLSRRSSVLFACSFLLACGTETRNRELAQQHRVFEMYAASFRKLNAISLFVTLSFSFVYMTFCIYLTVPCVKLFLELILNS